MHGCRRADGQRNPYDSNRFHHRLCPPLCVGCKRSSHHAQRAQQGVHRQMRVSDDISVTKHRLHRTLRLDGLVILEHFGKHGRDDLP